MYRRDAEWASARIAARLARAASPVEAVALWVEEILGLTRHPRRAERVSVLTSIRHAEGLEGEVTHSRGLLVAPLRAAVEAGVAGGAFSTADPAGDAELIAAAVIHAAGLASEFRKPVPHQQQSRVVAFALRALGARPS